MLGGGACLVSGSLAGGKGSSWGGISGKGREGSGAGTGTGAPGGRWKERATGAAPTSGGECTCCVPWAAKETWPALLADAALCTTSRCVGRA